MAIDNKETKFSELGLITSFSGKEIVPMAYLGTNPAATLEALKTYMSDSALQFFARIIDTNVPVGEAQPDLTEGEIAIVYLSYHKTFALEKTVSGASSYHATFPSRDNYMEGAQLPRTDRVFFCMEDKQMYIYTTAMVNIFSTFRINAMTEEDFENLENPQEGNFYATYED